MRQGYWIGYDNDEFGKESDLLSSYCPRGYCSPNGTARYDLPSNTNVTLLNEIVCGESRRGKICGKCQLSFTKGGINTLVFFFQVIGHSLALSNESTIN